MCAHFKVTVQIFWGPATSENATLRHEILELGSYNNLAQHRMWSFLFFKITPPYCTVLSLKMLFKAWVSKKKEKDTRIRLGMVFINRLYQLIAVTPTHQMGKMFSSVLSYLSWTFCCTVLGSWHWIRAYICTMTGDPARRPGIPQSWYRHCTVHQWKVKFNLTADASAPSLFPSSCIIYLWRKPKVLMGFLEMALRYIYDYTVCGCSVTHSKTEHVCWNKYCKSYTNLYGEGAILKNSTSWM